MTTVNTHIHVDSNEIIGANCLRLELKNEVFALKFGSPFRPYVTLFIDKQQLADICRDMEVVYMVEILGASEKEVRS